MNLVREPVRVCFRVSILTLTDVIEIIGCFFGLGSEMRGGGGGARRGAAGRECRGVSSIGEDSTRS